MYETVFNTSKFPINISISSGFAILSATLFSAFALLRFYFHYAAIHLMPIVCICNQFAVVDGARCMDAQCFRVHFAVEYLFLHLMYVSVIRPRLAVVRIHERKQQHKEIEISMHTKLKIKIHYFEVARIHSALLSIFKQRFRLICNLRYTCICVCEPSRHYRLFLFRSSPSSVCTAFLYCWFGSLNIDTDVYFSTITITHITEMNGYKNIKSDEKSKNENTKIKETKKKRFSGGNVAHSVEIANRWYQEQRKLLLFSAMVWGGGAATMTICHGSGKFLILVLFRSYWW